MGKQKIYDVCIIGAGPSGGYLATLLARQQVSVIIIEQSPLPRPKVCGGGLSQKSFRQLSLSPTAIDARIISGTYLGFKDKGVFYQEMPGAGYTVSRSGFDYCLAQQAVNAGATLMAPATFRHFSPQGTTITVSTSEGPVTARILVGADGVFSPVRKQLFPGKKPFLAHAIQAKAYPEDPRTLERFGSRTWLDFGAIDKGYGWIFPKREHFNIGLYKIATTTKNRPLRRLLAEFAAVNPLLQTCRLEEIRGGTLPVKPIGTKISQGNVLLTGDAAGLCESIFGEGIYYALRSARLAGKSIMDSLSGTNMLEKSYNQKIKVITKELFFSRILADIIYFNSQATFDWLVKNEWVIQQFTDLIRGINNHSTCLIKLVTGLPCWLPAPRRQVVSQKAIFDQLNSSTRSQKTDVRRRETNI
ncbi:MAG: geranylgeranyl reductase family protein [Pseudomonadota bacterium]|nr:geranylgeranyl reductase family protein [Pseudomonadota bacterium]